MCGQQNVKATARDNTGQNTDKGHTPNPRIGIKILDPAGNRTRAAGLEVRNSTAHATATVLYMDIINRNIVVIEVLKIGRGYYMAE